MKDKNIAPLSIEQAVDFFHSLANRRDLALGYVRTTCYPKAYMACEHALAHGFTPMKAWAAEGDKPLSGQHPSGGEFSWWYHVAVALPVQTAPGKIENLIFDPVLFDGPVTLKEWGDKIGAPADKLEILPYQDAPDRLFSDRPRMNAAHDEAATRRGKNLIESWSMMEKVNHRLLFPSETMKRLPVTKRPLRIGWDTAPVEPLEASLPKTLNTPRPPPG